MKKLILADVFYPDTVGGAGRVAYHLALELSRKGHAIHIITRNDNGKWPPYEELAPNLFVHRFFSPSKESLGLFLREIKNSHLMTKKLAQEIKFDLVCTHQSLVAIGPLLSRNFKQIPLIHYFHSPWHEEYLIKKQTDGLKGGHVAKTIAFFMKHAENQIMSRAKRIIVMSQYMTEKISQIHNLDLHKTAQIPGGIDLNAFSLPISGKENAKAAVNFPHDKTIFLTVRNLVPRMGLEALIEAFNYSDVLKRKCLLFVGGQGRLEGKLKDMVARWNLQQTIRFLGHIPEEDLPQLYQASDFFILPTRELEGFGLVILEAMACGTPVLGTPIGAIPEILGSFDRKLLFDGTGWQNMKRKLEEVIEKPDSFRFDPQDCRAFVERNFSWKKAAEAFEREAKRCIEEGQQAAS